MKLNRVAVLSVALAATVSMQGVALAQQINPNVQKAFDVFNAIMGAPVQSPQAAPADDTTEASESATEKNETTGQTTQALPTVTQDQAAKAIEQVTGLKTMTSEQAAEMEKLQAENKELKLQLDALRDLKTAELNRRLDELGHRKSELERHMKHMEEEKLFVNEQIEKLESEKAALTPAEASEVEKEELTQADS